MWNRALIPIRGGWVTSRCRFSKAVQEKEEDIDDFLTSLNNPSAPPSSKKRPVLETSTEFCKWMEQNPVKSVEQFITAAQLATTVKFSEQKEVFSKINSVAESVLPNFYDQLTVNEIVDSLRFVLQTCPDSLVSKNIQALFIQKNIKAESLQMVPYATLVMIARYSTPNVDRNILNHVFHALSERMDTDLANQADLFALMNAKGYSMALWTKTPKFLAQAEKLIPVISLSEKCAFLKFMAAGAQRDRFLLGLLINSICFDSNQCLSVSQIVSILNSCSTLTYYPPKMAKKVSEDLLKNSNVLKDWKDVISIADSLVKIRAGEPKTWNLIVRWATENVKKANFEQLSRLVSGLAHIGEPSGKPLAKELKMHLKLTKARNPNAWLNIIYSLAYFQELDADHADSVLNKSFLEQIMSSSADEHDELRKAMRLLMISAAAKVDIKDYKGPTVDKKSFTRFKINFNSKTTSIARQLKYTKNVKEVDEVFFKSLSKLAPKSSHWKTSDVEECGAFVDAYVMPAQNAALLVNKNEWGTHIPRPMMFYSWKQTKMYVNATGEEMILGPEQLGLRLMRAEGYDPVVVFNSEIEYCPNDTDKMDVVNLEHATIGEKPIDETPICAVTDDIVKAINRKNGHFTMVVVFYKPVVIKPFLLLYIDKSSDVSRLNARFVKENALPMWTNEDGSMDALPFDEREAGEAIKLDFYRSNSGITYTWTDIYETDGGVPPAPMRIRCLKNVGNQERMGLHVFFPVDSKNILVLPENSYAAYLADLEKQKHDNRINLTCSALGDTADWPWVAYNCGHMMCYHCYNCTEKKNPPQCHANCALPTEEITRVKLRQGPCPVDMCHKITTGGGVILQPCGCFVQCNFLLELVKNKQIDRSKIVDDIQMCPFEMCGQKLNGIQWGKV